MGSGGDQEMGKWHMCVMLQALVIFVPIFNVGKLIIRKGRGGRPNKRGDGRGE
jgi:hypothetical protein